MYLLNTNYADFSFLFTLHCGEPWNPHLRQEYLAVLETNHRTPYYLNLHYRDVAHTMILTASGHVYSFLLTEISNEPNAEPDLKIFVEPKEGSGVAGNSGLRGYVSAAEAEAYKKELDALRAQTADQIHAAQAQVAEQISRFRSVYATKLQFDYPLYAKAMRTPFLVTAIYHDDAFTYIKCDAREKPALYEIKDGKLNLISFQFENGVYIAPKIIDAGYLVVGKKKPPFTRRTAAN